MKCGVSGVRLVGPDYLGSYWMIIDYASGARRKISLGAPIDVWNYDNNARPQTLNCAGLKPNR